jgi:phosphopantothenoylcysteine decarboxylase/phosphopantothenate--cysteine ligase
MLEGREIHLCVCGGIAAYKAVELARRLARGGARVRVAMTPNARQFVGPLTFQAITQARVLTETLDPSDEMEIGHIAFAQHCDALVVAPATADVIGKAANGLADEVVSTVLVAANVPVVLAPAMNTFMYENPAVQANLGRLAARGWTIVEPTAGELACGQVGPGRMAEPDAIARVVEGLFAAGPLTGRRVVVSAGPTREPMDPVRFISNPSTGKAGFAIAAAAARAGAAVTLVHGPVAIAAPPGVKAVPVMTALEMHAAVFEAAADADALVMTAAVADYRPEAYSPQKERKGEEPRTLRLVRNPDILADLGARRDGARHPLLVGFAAETGDPVPGARDKLARKRVDLIVANDVTAEGSGFGTDTNRVWFVGRDGDEALPLLSKREVAERLVAWIAARLEANG